MAGAVPTYKLEFPYKRSLGPIVGAFLTGLRDRQVLGIRSAAGRVLVPPLEFDPETGEENLEWTRVGEAGVVRGFSWVEEPLPKHPLDRPFAWVLVQLDGADTNLVHVLDADSRAAVEIGMRVRIRWASETRGHMSDIACFEPEAG